MATSSSWAPNGHQTDGTNGYPTKPPQANPSPAWWVTARLDRFNCSRSTTRTTKTGGDYHQQGAAAPATHRSVSEMETKMRMGAIDSVVTCESAGITEAERSRLWEVALRLRVALLPEIFNTNRATWATASNALSFSGRVALHRILTVGLAPDEEAAVKLANRLLFIGALCGASGPSMFSITDSPCFRFAVDRYALLANVSEQEDLMSATRVGGAMATVSFHTMAELAHGMQDSEGGVATTAHGVGPPGIPVFSGEGAVDWLVNNGVAANRENACDLAKALVRAGAFAEMNGQRNFFDHSAIHYSFAESNFYAAVLADCRVSGGYHPHGRSPAVFGMTGEYALEIADGLALGNNSGASVYTLPSFSTETSERILT